MDLPNSKNEDLFFSINIAPLVDVTLVLLIIFMLTTPILVASQIRVELPKAVSGELGEANTFVIAVDKEGQIFLNGEQSDEAGLVEYIKEHLPKNPDLQAVISADALTYHQNVIRVIDLIRSHKVRRFAINVDPVRAEPREKLKRE